MTTLWMGDVANARKRQGLSSNPSKAGGKSSGPRDGRGTRKKSVALVALEKDDRFRARCTGCIARFFGSNLQAATYREIACHAVALAIGLIIVLPALMLLLDRGPVIDIHNPRIVPGKAERGAEVEVTWEATELRPNCSGRVSRYIVDSSGHIFTFATVPTVYHETLQENPTRTFKRKISIPRGAALGPATYKSRLERWCNFMQEHLWPIKEIGPDIKFTVTERSGANAPIFNSNSANNSVPGER